MLTIVEVEEEENSWMGQQQLWSLAHNIISGHLFFSSQPTRESHIKRKQSKEKKNTGKVDAANLMRRIQITYVLVYSAG